MNANEIETDNCFNAMFVKLYPELVACLRKRFNITMVEDMGVNRRDVEAASAFLTGLRHFNRGEFEGLSVPETVAELARFVYNRWHRHDRHGDTKHISYSATRPDGERAIAEPEDKQTMSPEDEDRFRADFSEALGEVKGQLTADIESYLPIIRASIERPGTQKEIAKRCGCSQPTVSRALRWLKAAISSLKTAD